MQPFLLFTNCIKIYFIIKAWHATKAEIVTKIKKVTKKKAAILDIFSPPQFIINIIEPCYLN
jgi:hypothetical protein